MVSSIGRDEPDSADDDPVGRVSVCETRPGRVVFTESDNPDAWIATDLTVDVDP